MVRILCGEAKCISKCRKLLLGGVGNGFKDGTTRRSNVRLTIIRALLLDKKHRDLAAIFCVSLLTCPQETGPINVLEFHKLEKSQTPYLVVPHCL